MHKKAPNLSNAAHQQLHSVYLNVLRCEGGPVGQQFLNPVRDGNESKFIETGFGTGGWTAGGFPQTTEGASARPGGSGCSVTDPI